MLLEAASLLLELLFLLVLASLQIVFGLVDGEFACVENRLHLPQFRLSGANLLAGCLLFVKQGGQLRIDLLFTPIQFRQLSPQVIKNAVGVSQFLVRTGRRA